MEVKRIVEERELLEIEDIEIAARGLVDGFLSGMNKSLITGQNSEFMAHRDYFPGDNIRHINWKLWARTDHLYVKQFESDYNHCLYIAVDDSGSMRCANSKISKWQFSIKAAAALSFLALKRRDAPSLIIGNGKLNNLVEPGISADQFHRILGVLTGAKAKGRQAPAAMIQNLPSLCARRGIVVVISDFFDNEENLLNEAATLVSMGQDVIFLQIFDPWEVSLPENGLYKFKDLELMSFCNTDVRSVAKAYQRVFSQWRADFESKCTSLGIELISQTTEDSLTYLFTQYLEKRGQF